VGAWTVADAAQSVGFLSVDVQQMDCDFLAFSAHKIYGPYGTGVLYGRQDVLELMPPYRGGGAMIASVSQEKSDFLPPPQRFEAGTPNISGVIGMGAAIDYILNLGADNIERHERMLLGSILDQIKNIPAIEIMGESSTRTNILSFNIRGVHGSDIGQILDQQGVAVRAGHHCTQPLMKRFGVTGSVRASLGVYNSREDVEIFTQALKKSLEMLT
jgi:cysteine desulfurase/selenocysteine lyase